MSYPSTITSFTNPQPTDRLNSPSHSGIETAQNTGLTEIQTFVGTITSTAGTLMYDVRSPNSDGGGHVQTAVKGGTGQTSYNKGDLLVGTSPSVISKFAVGPDGYGIIANSSVASGLQYQVVATTQNLQNQTATFASASVISASVWGISFPNIVSVLAAGQAFQVKFPTANTSSSIALVVSSLIALRIKNPDLTNPAVGSIPASSIGILENDGTQFQIQRTTDQLMSVSDIAMNNVSSIAHGFAPKSNGDLNTFLRGDGAYASVAGATYYNSVFGKDSADAASVLSLAHGLGKTPKYVKLTGMKDGGASQPGAIASATYNGTTQSAVSMYFINNATLGTASAFRINTAAGAGDSYTAGVITVTSTNVVITWSKTGSPTGIFTIVAEAQG